MRRALVLALALAGCGSERSPEAPRPTAAASREPTPWPSASIAVRDHTPPELTPAAEKGEKGARNLLLAWASAMEDRAFGAAYDLFGAHAERTGMSASAYAAEFASYRTVTVAISEGTVEGACGSLYYEVPVTLTGTTQAGATYVRDGTIVLRRVNDVDGATPAQLRWHLDRLDWTE